MKSKLMMLTALILVSAFAVQADPTVFFTEDFQSYNTGDFLPQCETATIYQSKYQTNFAYRIESDVMDTKCLTVTKNDPDGFNSGNSGVWIPTGATEEMFTETGIMRIRLKHRSISNISGFVFGNGSANDNGRALWCYRNGGTFYIIHSNKTQMELSGIGGDKDNELEFNIQYPSRRLVNVIANGVTNVPENVTLPNIRITHIGAAVLAGGYVAAGSGYVTAIDDIEVAYEALTTPVASMATDPVLIGRSVASRDFVVANNGGGSFDYRVSALGDPEWLSFAPTGVCKTTKSHKVTFNRDVMGDGFYRTILTFDCSPYGVFDIPLNVRSGKVFYYEDFEAPFMQEGEIHGQQGWFGKEEGNDYSPATNEAYVNTPSEPWDGQCLTVQKASGWDGYWYPIWTPSNLIIKVSCKFRWDPVGEADRFYFRSTYWANPAIFDLWYATEAKNIRLWAYNDTSGYPLVGDYGLAPNTWHDMSYTLDFRMQTLTDFTFGDFVTNFSNQPLRKRMNDKVVPMHYFEKFGFSGGGEDSRVGVSIDDLLVTEVERAKIAIPWYEKAVCMGGLDVYTNTLENAGAQNYKFTAEVLDYPDNLKLSRYKGSIGTKGLVLYRLNRSGLKDGYYTSRIKYEYEASNGTNSGSFVQLVTFGVGPWYYTTEFEGELFKLGPIDGQECWKTEYAYGDTDIRLFDGAQCLYFDQAAKTKVSAGVQAGQHYSFRCRLNFPDNNNTTYVKFSQIDDKGCLPVIVRRDRETKELVLAVQPDGSGQEEVARVAGALGQWINFSYNMDLDPASACMTQFVLGDYVKDCEIGEYVLNTEHDEQPIDCFIIEAVNDGPDEERDTGVYVDNVVVCDHSVPEPAVLGALLLAIAFLSRRK
ncbi:PEP-CTERM sorting domain-containing protein [bacterium]|nr:PEP-CTERM sorting domain-containing protein [bacterium]